MAKLITPRTNIVRGFTPSRPPAPQQTIRLDAPPAANEHCERILLLEDEAQTNFILREYLQSLGYQVVAVANGVDGLREVMQSEFELVICDMMMPKLPGDMFYLAVQKTRPQLCNRFVFITGHQANPAVDAFIMKTHSAILVKPFRLQQLEATLESILSRFPKKLHPLHHDNTPADKTVTPTKNVPLDEESEVKESSSMISKALRMVGGFMRGSSTPRPVPPTQSMQTPRINCETPQETSRVTRRIAHLAVTPVADAQRRMPNGQPVDTSATVRVTRRIAPPSSMQTSTVPASSLAPKKPAVSPVDGKTPTPIRVSRLIRGSQETPPTPSKGLLRGQEETRGLLRGPDESATKTTRKISPESIVTPLKIVSPKTVATKTAKVTAPKTKAAKVPAAKSPLKLDSKKAAAKPTAAKRTKKSAS